MASKTEFENRLRGQSDAEIKRVFYYHAENHNKANELLAEDPSIQTVQEIELIPKCRLGNALKELHFRDIEDDAVDDIYLMNASSHSDKGMTLLEFSHASRSPSKIQQWLETLELPRLLDLSIPQGENGGMYEGLGSLWNLDEDNIKNVVSLFAEQVQFALR